jgi:hypothetical protein
MDNKIYKKTVKNLENLEGVSIIVANTLIKINQKNLDII